MKSSNYKELIKTIHNSYKNKDNSILFILIGGCAQTGKTTLAKKIIKEVSSKGINSLLISLDNWLLSLDKRTGNETVRERYNYLEIIDTVKKIMEGKEIISPSYNSKTRTTLFKEDNLPISIDKGICILDGVISLDIGELRNISEFSIFVEIPDEIRKERLQRFYTDYKNCTPQETRKITDERELEEVPIIKSTKKEADIIYNPDATYREQIILNKVQLS